VILSVSRRTDIPAYFSSWFYNRIKEGMVCVRNPVNLKQISRIKLSPKTIECIVFWTKNPSREFINNLSILDDLGYKYYFQFTLTPYNKSLEKNLPPKKEVINNFVDLSKRIGKQKIIWRYDPIIINNEYSIECHVKYFEYIIKQIGLYTNKCIISFVDIYKNIRKRLHENDIHEYNDSEMKIIAESLYKMTVAYGLTIESCCEKINLSSIGIEHGHCIDGALINEIVGKSYLFEKDKTQRDECGCIASVDIGAYNTCQHNCLYCYANWVDTKDIMNSYNENSPILCSNISTDDKISDRIIKKCDLLMQELFD
jgi:hypothetical protein